MINTWILVLIALAYVGLLFLIAWTGDRKRLAGNRRNLQAAIYALSLAVYCSSWTFYGAVGSAATAGWGFLAIYIGPALMVVLGFGMLQRIARNSRDQRIASIADFIAHRYGRSHLVAVLVTLAAVIGSVPYIALQLKGITTGFDVVGRATGMNSLLMENLSLYIALALALFSMLFGTRTMDASEHHRGLMWAIAFESIVKLLAFVTLGLFVVFFIFSGPRSILDAVQASPEYRELFSTWRLPSGFGTQLILAMAAILCLPRQFHVAFVEFRNSRELRVARWVFPTYLMVFAGLVMPIALAGLEYFSGQGSNPDTYVLAIPIALDRKALALLAFLGGFSAATGMVIVATVALAVMVSNDIVMPLLLRFGAVSKSGDLSRTVLRVRRISILAVTLVAYLYYQAIRGGVPLASIGLLSFSAAAQFAPALILGLYWRGASRIGALSGLFVGVTAWLFFQLLPSFSQSPDAPALIPFEDAALMTLALNAVVLVVMSLLAPDRELSGGDVGEGWRGQGMITLNELQQTIARFLGVENTRRALSKHLGVTEIEPAALAAPATLQFGERLLAGSIGSASARTVLATALYRRGLGAEAVLELLDRTSQAVQFNRELLESTLDNLSQGVSVIDADLRLVGWNRAYVDMMNYPKGALYLGQSVEELIRINAQRGLLAGGDGEADIARRVARLRGGDSYRYERAWLDERVIEIQGNPLPGGGYVTTFTDITHFKDIERELQEINETLEQRVMQRTRELSDAVREVEKARELAEAANQSKTRFLAAASHDLLQPMNAARLFVSILEQQQQDGGEQEQVVKRIDRSLSAAEQLLGALLDISKLDSGMYRPEPEAFEVRDLFEQLKRRFSALAENKHLQLRIRCPAHSVLTDRNLLYRILQNFLANAIRYTERGGVLLGCRVRGDSLRISVWDTGVGIDPADQTQIFQEFHRLHYAEQLEEKGLGLGLAICDRIAHMLEHPIDLASRPGHGSCFSVTVPLTAVAESLLSQPATGGGGKAPSAMQGVTVLCVDNEQDILDGMQMLLERWGCTVCLAAGISEALQQVERHGAPDLALIDYHLDAEGNGIDVLQALDQRLGRQVKAILITADRTPALEEEAEKQGYGLLRKPIRPAALRALMTHFL